MGLKWTSGKWGRRTDPLAWRHTKRTVWEVRWFAGYSSPWAEDPQTLHLWKTPHTVTRPRTLRPVPASFRLGHVAGDGGVVLYFNVCPICLYSRGVPEGIAICPGPTA